MLLWLKKVNGNFARIMLYYQPRNIENDDMQIMNELRDIQENYFIGIGE